MTDRAPEQPADAPAAVRPAWCPHASSCRPMVSFQESICGGRMAEVEDHNDDFNTHRLCFNDDTGGPPFDLQVNHSDLFWLFKVLDSIRHDADRAYRAESKRRRAQEAIR